MVLGFAMEGFLGDIFREDNRESSHFCLGKKDTQNTHIYTLAFDNGPVRCLRTLPLESSSSLNNCGTDI